MARPDDRAHPPGHLRERLLRQYGCTAIELAVRAPIERTARLGLVARRLAARLRRRTASRELARLAIDARRALDAGADPTRAAYTCAVALHADDGDLRTAVKLGEELLAEGTTRALRARLASTGTSCKDAEDALARPAGGA